ncbi:MAG: energy transducer TonB [Pseudomonadota bacterium]
MYLHRLAPILFALSIHAALLWALQANFYNQPLTKAQGKEIIAQLISRPQPVPAVETQSIEPPKPKSVVKRQAPAKPLPPIPASTDSERAIIQAPVAAPSQEEVVSAPAPASASTETKSPPPSAPRFDANYLQNPAPSYPPLSRRLHETGTVLLRVFVSAKGLAINVQLHSSSGSSRLDEAAMEAVRRWRFVPARQANEPIAATVLVPIDFQLD